MRVLRRWRPLDLLFSGLLFNKLFFDRLWSGLLSAVLLIVTAGSLSVSLAQAQEGPANAAAAANSAAAPDSNSALADSAGHAARPQIRFTYENEKLQPAKYVVLVRENGSGHYSSQPGNAATEEGQFPVRPNDREIEISKPTREALFSGAREAGYFSGNCSDGGGKIAFQGNKTLEYQDAARHGNCTYNWSEDKHIQLLTAKFEAISLTLEEGRKLETEHAHARLSLDPELEFLDRMAKQGDAIEIENIAAVLTAIESDDAVLERARRRARSLLDMAKDQTK